MPKFSSGVTTDPPLDLLAKQLRGADKALGRKLGQVNKSAAQPIAQDAQNRARTPQQAHFASGIKAKGSASEVAISVGGAPGTVGAFFGAKRWKQFPEWVGNDWEVGGTDGPHAVNPAIHDALPKLMDDYGQAVVDVWSEAFEEAGK